MAKQEVRMRGNEGGGKDGVYGDGGGNDSLTLRGDMITAEASTVWAVIA
jgi:hypothetical protein